jgi:hypothetical protein
MHATKLHKTQLLLSKRKPCFLPNNNNENDGDGSIEDIVTIIIFFFCKLEIVFVVGGAKKTSFMSTTRTRT